MDLRPQVGIWTSTVGSRRGVGSNPVLGGERPVRFESREENEGGLPIQVVLVGPREGDG